MDERLISEVFMFVNSFDMRYLKSAIKVPMRGWRMASRDLQRFNLDIALFDDLLVKVRVDRDENILKIKGVNRGNKA